jgi:hypothetical protein
METYVENNIRVIPIKIGQSLPCGKGGVILLIENEIIDKHMTRDKQIKNRSRNLCFVVYI